MRIERLVLWSRDALASEAFLDRFINEVLVPPPGTRFGRVAYRQSDGTRETGTEGLHDTYWKFSVFADDIDSIGSRIRKGGVSVSDPIQFLEIGYLAHLDEPGGNQIELLQRTFLPPRDPRAADGFSGAPTLGLITLRVTDLPMTLDLLVSTLGMSHLATMEVNDGRPDPFRLEFLAWTDDQPPGADPLDVVNREWLYQRGYTVIELQHGPNIGRLETTAESGLSHIEISASNLDEVRSTLDAQDIAWQDAGDVVVVATPDGHELHVWGGAQS